MLHDFDLTWTHTKIVILLKKRDRAVMSVIGDHDAKGYHEFLTQAWVNLPRPFLTGQGILRIELKVRVIFGNSADRETDFDSREAEAFSKTPSNQDKAEFG